MTQDERGEKVGLLKIGEELGFVVGFRDKLI